MNVQSLGTAAVFYGRENFVIFLFFVIAITGTVDYINGVGQMRQTNERENMNVNKPVYEVYKNGQLLCTSESYEKAKIVAKAVTSKTSGIMFSGGEFTIVEKQVVCFGQDGEVTQEGIHSLCMDELSLESPIQFSN